MDLAINNEISKNTSNNNEIEDFMKQLQNTLTKDNSRINNIYNSYEKASNKNKLQYGEQIYPLIEIVLHNIVAENAINDTSGTGETDDADFSSFIMNEFKKVEEYMNNQLK